MRKNFQPPAKPGVPPDEQVARLRKQNAELRARFRAIQYAPTGKAIIMSSQLARAIRAALHPDRAIGNPKERKRLEDLSQEFNSFKIVPPSSE